MSAADESTASDGALDAYRDQITSLLRTYVRRDGEPHVIAVSPKAMMVLNEFSEAVNHHVRNWSLPDGLKGYPRRWHELACKLALVVHVAANGANAHDHEVSEETARNAVRLMTWFAGRQEELLHDYVATKARPKYGKALELVERAPTGITARDAARKSVVFDSAQEAEVILNELVREGRIQSTPRRKGKVYQRLPGPSSRP
jgi:hypothetical protein